MFIIKSNFKKTRLQKTKQAAEKVAFYFFFAGLALWTFFLKCVTEVLFCDGYYDNILINKVCHLRGGPLEK